MAGLFQKNQEHTSTQSVFKEQVAREEREHKSESEKVEECETTLLMLESEIDEVRHSLELALAQYDVTIQVNQAKNQLNIVVNRGAESLFEYLELTKSVEDELKAIKSNGFKFNGVNKFKLIGRISGSTQPEWQKFLCSDNEVTSSLRQSSNSDYTFNELKQGASKDVEEGKVYSEFQAKAIETLHRFWKWYISGFASRPDKAMYESPRFYRIVLTFLFFSGLNPLTLIFLPFLPKDTVSNSSTPSPIASTRAESSSSSVPATSATKIEPTLCVKKFNQGASLASATFDWSNQTMNVYIMPGIVKTEQDAEKVTDALANSIFSGCNIKTVKFEISGYDGYLIRTSP